MNSTLNKKFFRQKGQSTVEFLMGLVLIMAFIMSFIQLAFNYTDGFMIHYATFMASRSYLVYDDNSASEDGADARAKEKAQEVFDKLSYTKRIDANMKVHNPTGGHNEIYTGIYATFDQFVSIINFFGGIKSVTLRSESFLGREPTRGTCAKRICKRMDDEIRPEACTSAGTTGDNNHITLFDNGC